MFKLEIKKAAVDGVLWSGPHVSLRASCNALFQIADENCCGENGYRDWIFKFREVKSIEDHVSGHDTIVSDVFECGGVELTREISFNEKDHSSFHIRLLIRNRRNEAVRLIRLIPIIVEGSENLLLGEYGASKWSLFTSARHKNGVPSTCILGRVDASYMDALKSTIETKERIIDPAKEIPCTLLSDELTVLRGNEGRGPGSLLLGFLTAMSQLVTCKISMDSSRELFEKLEVSCLMDRVILEPGEERVGEWLRVDGNENVFSAIEKFARIKGKFSNSFPLPNPPSVYCTWYYYGGTITQEDIIENLNAIKQHKIPLDVFQIDEGWERDIGDWEPNEKFSLGMKYLADLIRSYGMRPGIWTSPFIVSPECEIGRRNPDWLLMRDDGIPVMFRMFGKRYYVLDTTHPEVLEWIENLYRKLTYEWGYTYHKIDFARAVVLDPKAIFRDKKATRAEAYRRGLEAVRRGAGSESYILLCGGLYGASSGLVNGQRTSSDARSCWPKSTDPSEIVAPHTIKQNVLRYWMNYLWHNDPDALMVRRKKEPFRGLDLSLGLLTDDEAKIFALNQYFAGGIICFTERIQEVDRDRLGLLRHIIPSIGRSAVPRDMFLGKRYPSIYDVEVNPVVTEMGKWHTVAFINWSNESLKPAFNLDENIVGEFSRNYEEYFVSEFWSGNIWNCVKYGDRIELKELKKHSAALVKIAPQIENEPVLLYSNGHFSMGGTEITLWEYEGNRLRVGMKWQWDYPVEFIIQAPKNTRWTRQHVNKKPFKIDYYRDKGKVRILLQSRFSGTIELKLD